MRISRAILATVAIVVCALAGVSAKGVWSDEFIGPSSTEPRAELPRYRVAFHVLPNGKPQPRVLYVVTYAHDPISGEAFIYLPGQDEEHYALNVSTIVRGGRDGGWHLAVPAWAEALNERLPRQRASR